jgi:hypothetical protein
MKPEDFDKLVESVFAECKALLTMKQKEYSEGKDRLDQFTKGELMTGLPAHRVLAGMMLKHTTSIYDMLQHDSTLDFSIKKWKEKIFDHINYLCLLMGILDDNQRNKKVEI